MGNNKTKAGSAGIFWKNDANLGVGDVQSVSLRNQPYNRRKKLIVMRFRIALALIFMAALTRLLPHPPNFTPIGAMGLFGAAYFGNKRLALIIPFVALFVSDLILNNVVYSQYYTSFTWFTSSWIYLGFALVMLSGYFILRNDRSPARIVAASLTASVLFFLVSNLSTWMGSGLYPKTFAGLMTCYTAGLPFIGNTLMGDLFFSAVMFGSYSWFLKTQMQRA